MAPPQDAALAGLGLPPDRLDRLSQTVGMPVWSGGAPGQTAPDRVFLLMGPAPEDAIDDRFAQSYAAWIEVADYADDEVIHLIDEAMSADIFASLTTHTAGGLDLAGRMVGAIARHRALPQVKREDMELALHEAITNAVVHGNLQVDGMKGLSVSALDRFAADLTARMADPAFASRRVEVLISFQDQGAVVEITDQGIGFRGRRKSKPATTTTTTTAKASGRGLHLIAAIAQSYELLDNGRRIRMRFAL
ncbi:MAG TPA: ATP-binding protein [Azospirillaceae bacterium]|nr:ATP-binding protein [Azospirillaceae bacterium]